MNQNITEELLDDYELPAPTASVPNPGDGEATTSLESDAEAVSGGDRRQGERRVSNQRREGLRGEWEDRRLFDRRKREYSMFGKRLDGIDDEETDVSKVPDVPDELLLSPTELEIFAEQDEAERTKNHNRRHDDEPKTRRRL